jgi:hypothetical protein
MTTSPIGMRRPHPAPRQADVTPSELDAIAAAGQWYVTAHTVTARVLRGRVVELPVSQAHAKRMGTLLTACGTWAYSWRKIYDLSFPLPNTVPSALDTCPGCLDVVVAEWRA